MHASTREEIDIICAQLKDYNIFASRRSNLPDSINSSLVSLELMVYITNLREVVDVWLGVEDTPEVVNGIVDEE